MILRWLIVLVMSCMGLFAQSNSRPILSCNDESSALALSLQTQKPFYASDGWVEITKTGEVFAENDFYQFSKGQKVNTNSGPTSGYTKANAPGVAGVDFVRLGAKQEDVGTLLVAALTKRGIAKADADDLFLLLSYSQGKLKSSTPLMDRVLKIIPNVNFKNPENLLVELKKCVNDNGEITDLVAFEKFSKQVDDALVILNKKGLAYIPPRNPTRLAGAINSVYEVGIAPKGTIMYHYTSIDGYNGILSSKTLRPSLTTSVPNHAHFGNGYYLSDMPLNTKSLEGLSTDFVRNTSEGDRFAYCVAIDVSGMKIFQGVGDRSAVFLIEGVSDLDLSSRLILSKCGKNTKLK